MKTDQAEIYFNFLELWRQLELVRGIAVMSNEFLVSAMETTERQGERRILEGKERMGSSGEGKEGSFVTFAIMAQSLQPAGYRQTPCRRSGKQGIYLLSSLFALFSFCSLGVVACKK